MMAALVASAIPFVRSYGWPQDWKPRAIELYALARHNAPLAAADAIEWGSRRLDTVILGLFVSPAMVGIYWVAQQIVSVPQKLKTSFDPVLGPVITRALDEGDRPAVARQISQVGFWIRRTARHRLVAGALRARTDGIDWSEAGFCRWQWIAGPAARRRSACLSGGGERGGTGLRRAAQEYAGFAGNDRDAGGAERGADRTRQGARMAGRLQAAGAAAALAISLGLGSLGKAALAKVALGAPVSVWRWTSAPATLAAMIIGLAAHRLPGWMQLAVGLPATLGLFGWIIWTYGFSEEDRALFRKARSRRAARHRCCRALERDEI